VAGQKTFHGKEVRHGKPLESLTHNEKPCEKGNGMHGKGTCAFGERIRRMIFYPAYDNDDTTADSSFATTAKKARPQYGRAF